MSTDNKPTVQQAAKQGNPQAIAILLNRQLQPKGITAKISAKNSCLQIMLEAANVPNQKGLVAAIQKWIDGLGIDSIQRVQIYAKQTGQEIPVWNDSFEVVRQLEEPKIADTVISPTVPTEIVKSDVKVEEINASKLDPDLLELAKNGDTKAIAELIKSTLQQADVTVRATLNKELLQVVIVSNKVPEQDKFVGSIPELVTSFKSTLIQKIKVVGMQEIDGSNNSNIFWVQESVIEMPSEQVEKASSQFESNNIDSLVKLANNINTDAIGKLCALEIQKESLEKVEVIVDIETIGVLSWSGKLNEEKLLKIDVYCNKLLNQNTLIASIYKVIKNLNLNFVQYIEISNYIYERLNPEWKQEFSSLQEIQKLCDLSETNHVQYDSLITKYKNLKSNVVALNFSFLKSKVIIIVSFILLLIVLFLASISMGIGKKRLIDSQTAKPALAELQKLNSRLELGINLIEYKKGIADYKFAVETFINSDDSLVNPRYTILLKDSLNYHIDSLNVWQTCKTSGCNVSMSFNGQEISGEASFMKEIVSKYPQIEQKIDKLNLSDNNYALVVSRDDVLQYIWKTAKESENVAFIELNK